jgi:hypothetical protein
MKRIFKILTVSFLALMLNACILSSRPLYELPTTYDEEAPDIWKLAWQDGCQSGYSVYGNSMFKQMYKFKQDVTKMSNPTYYKGWRDAFNYCRAYVNRYLAGESKTTEESPKVLSDNSLDFKFGNKRDDAGILKRGLFSSGKDTGGLFSGIFTLSVPGYDGIPNTDGSCDWLNRCGDDKPKDPFDAMLGI